MLRWDDLSMEGNAVGCGTQISLSLRNDFTDKSLGGQTQQPELAQRGQPESGRQFVHHGSNHMSERYRHSQQRKIRRQQYQFSHGSEENSQNNHRTGFKNHRDLTISSMSRRQPLAVLSENHQIPYHNVRPQRAHVNYHTGSPTRQRPPLARLPENRMLSRYSRGLRSIGEYNHTQPPVTKHRRKGHDRQEDTSNPRRLLWPTIATTPPVPSISTLQNSGDQPGSYPEERDQRAKPLAVRNDFRTIADMRQDFQLARSPLESTSEGRKLSLAEQRYAPKTQEQLKLLRKGTQSRYHQATVEKTIGTNYSPSHRKRDRRPSLAERIVGQLPLSPPTLHIPDEPANPGSPRAESPVKGRYRPNRDDALDSTVLAPNFPSTHPPASMRKMLRWEIWLYRLVLSTVIVALNISILMLYLKMPKHHYLLAFLVFMKSKDLLSTIAGIIGCLWNGIRDSIWKPADVDSRWIMSIVCAYAETEAQIVKTVDTLVKQDLVQHKQVICIILDGKPRNVLRHFTRVTHTMEKSYTTWKGIRGDLQIHAGWMKDTPVILIQKVKNAGKKDTLILGHSLFNYPRDDVPTDLKLFRRDIFAHILPDLTGMEAFKSFDYVYATDADSIVHKDCLKELANALSRNTKAIAACGIILAELEDGTEWSAWHLFQQFQYTFGQYIRRQAESLWGRVTCLPGPVTMISVRPEMGRAISEYAAPITTPNLFLHQVQYQGTDRRLTWCMLAQGKHLQTILVTKAIGETVVPSSLDHYLSQRRRWAANAYFNDYMYAFGKNQHIITRLFGVIDIVRMSFVYYRVMNTALFLRSLIRVFYMLKIIPTLVMTKSPTVWFLLLMLIREPVLRKRLHKLLLGIALNQFMSPILSVIVFSRVLINMGNHAWGRTGVSSKDAMVVPAVPAPQSPRLMWSPRKLVAIVKNAIDNPLPQVMHPIPQEKPELDQDEDLCVSPSTISTISAASQVVDDSSGLSNLSTPQKSTPPGSPDWSATPAKNSSAANTNFNPNSSMRKRNRPYIERTPCRIPAVSRVGSISDDTNM